MSVARRWAAPVAILLIFAAQILIRFHSGLNHDAAWYVYVAQQLLAGKKLYVDIIEVNPPFGMWLTVPPVYVANGLGLAAVPVFYVFLFLCTALSLWLGAQFQGPDSDDRVCAFRVAAAVALLFLPAANFGEREHLIALFFLPWVMARLPEAKPAHPALSVLAGILAAAAIAMKPQAIFAPLLVEATLYWQLRTKYRLLTAENAAALVSAIALAAAAAVVTPEFFTSMLRLDRLAYLPYYGFPVWLILQNAAVPVLLIIIALLRGGTGANVLSAAAIGFLISYFLQDKGFAYQSLPATVFGFLAVVAGIADWRPQRLGKNLQALAGLAVCAIAVIAPMQRYFGNNQAIGAAVAQASSSVHSVFMASTKVSHAFPFVVERNLIWASREPTQWMMPYVADHWHGGALPDDDVVHRALDVAVSDLVNLKPDMVIIDQSQDQLYVPGGRFDYLDFWSRDPRFADFWKAYQESGNIDGFAVYSLAQK